MTDAPLHDALRDRARSQKRLDRWASVVRTLAVAVGAVGALALFDALVALPPAARLAAAAFLVAISIALLFARLRPVNVHRADLHRAAARLGEPVLTAFELQPQPGDTDVRRALVARVADRAAALLAQSQPEATLDRRSLRRAGGLLRLAAIAALAVEVALPGATRAALTRALDPLRYHPAWTPVAFTIRTTPDVILAGDDLTITTQIEGGAGDVQLLIVESDIARPRIVESIPLDSVENDRWRVALRNQREPVSFILRRGAASSRLVTIEPVLAPRMTGAVARITGPDAAERSVSLALDTDNTLTLTPDETAHIDLATTTEPASIRGAESLPVRSHAAGATIEIADAGALSLTPIGPRGDAAPGSLRIDVQIASTAPGEPDLATAPLPGQLAGATAPLTPGSSGESSGATGETAGEAGEPGVPTEATPTIAQGSGAEGPNRIARGQTSADAVAALPLESARSAAVEIIARASPQDAAPVVSAPPIPERYRDLAARYFRRVVRDAGAPGGTP